jgi:hypothetical protein
MLLAAANTTALLVLLRVTGVSTVACVPAVTGVLLLVVSLLVPGVGITSVPNVPAAADAPAVTYIHAVALYLLLLASLLSHTSLRFLWQNGDDG